MSEEEKEKKKEKEKEREVYVHYFHIGANGKKYKAMKVDKYPNLKAVMDRIVDIAEGTYQDNIEIKDKQGKTIVIIYNDLFKEQI